MIADPALLADMRRWIAATTPHWHVLAKDPRNRCAHLASAGDELVRRADGVLEREETGGASA